MSATNTPGNGDPERPTPTNSSFAFPPRSQTQSVPPSSQQSSSSQIQPSSILGQSFDSLQFTQTSLPKVSFHSTSLNEGQDNVYHDSGPENQLLASGHIPPSTQPTSSDTHSPAPTTDNLLPQKHWPHTGLTIWHIFNHGATLQIMLWYYRKTHTIHYAESQTPENIRMPLSTPERDPRVFLQEVHDTFKDERRCDTAQPPALDRCFEAQNWDIDRLDRWFVREMTRMLQACLYRNEFRPASARWDFWPTHEMWENPDGWQRLIYFLDWFKNELAPENWESSIVPELLVLRGKDDLHGLEHSHENCGHYVFEVNHKVAYHPMMTLPSPLVRGRSLLISG